MTVDRYLGLLPDLSAFETEQTVTCEATELALGALALYGCSVVAMVLTPVLPAIFTVPLIVLSLSFVPGILLLLALQQERLTVSAEHVLYAFGSSLVILMFTGAVVNILLPYVGVMNPLMAIPLAAGVTVAVAVLGVIAQLQGQGKTVTVRIPAFWSPEPLSLLLLPLLTIVGVILINTTGINVLILLLLLVVAATPIIAIRRLQDRWYPLTIWMVSLAILYHKSLWQYAGFGGRPHGITAWEAGRWSPGIASIEPYSSELLQNGVLFPMYARLSDIFILTQYEVVNPFFVSFIPLALYVAFRQYVSTEKALLGAALFAFCHPFYLQYPTAGRAATPVIFLSLFGVTISNHDLPSGSRGVLAVLFLAGIVVTHYGTSYYVVAAFLVAIVLLYSLWAVDEVVTRFRHGEVVQDGGTAVEKGSDVPRQLTIFSVATVFFFMTAAFGWYLYTRGGWKFDLLPHHFYDNLKTLMTSSTETGRTAARVEGNQQISVELSSYIYIVLTILMAVGFAVVYYKRVFTREQGFDDGYLTIATALFGIFGTTLILRNWGGGRPMMITFSFTTVFAVIGALWLADGLGRISGSLGRRISWRPSIPGHMIPENKPTGTQAFASLLLVFFILNSGIAATVVFGGFAPSNVPAQSTLVADQSPESQVTVHRDTDIITHIWMINNLDERHAVYGDTFGARQFDWYRPDVAARTPQIGGGYTQATKPEVFDIAQQRDGTQPGYLLIMGHNLELDAVWQGKFREPAPLREISVNERNRIYTNGESDIYFYTRME
ncbi:DUF2206 domain-containing protein [Halobacteriaceae archaeon SHR40]|uniref:DUF2206 domain-containing protein n=1 Tax=Halovenus amylolytica TaxID=2500550 RepID=UPI000FE38CE2